MHAALHCAVLQALSNQKLFEARKRFGYSRCGLQTGDTSLNTEASIVVMTTEILRNIMYRTAEMQEEGGPHSSTSAGGAEAGRGGGGGWPVVFGAAKIPGDGSVPWVC